MSVTPSPIGGYAAQFFDNNGQPLSGGKIYTYAAGTTTPQATYTSGLGTTPHANPIVLDSAGRVPGGEIWLTDSLIYKFVIETSTAVLIGTYDNIAGVNSNFVNYTVQEEVITATAGQTVFNLATINYTPGTNSLSVYIDGVNQYVGDSYLETDSTTVTFTSGLHVGAEVKFTTAVQVTTGTMDAENVSYNPPFLGGAATNVEDKLAQYVSVKDFGAVGDGVTDDTAAWQAFLDYISTNESAGFVPIGIYKITDELTYTNQYHPLAIWGPTFSGNSPTSPCVLFSANLTNGLLINGMQGSQGCDITGLYFKGASGFTVDNAIQITNLRNPRVSNCRFTDFNAAALLFSDEAGVADSLVIAAIVRECWFTNTNFGVQFTQTESGQSNAHTIENCSFYDLLSGIRFEGIYSNNLRVLNNTFENITGDDIYLKQAVTVLVQGNYFETNAAPAKSVFINFWQGQSGVYFDAITVSNNNFQGAVQLALIGASSMLGMDAFSNHYAGVGNKPFLRITNAYNNLAIERPSKYQADSVTLTYTVVTTDGAIAVSDQVFNYRRAPKGEATAIAVFDGTSTGGAPGNCTLIYSQNVSSVTYNNIADYTVNFAYDLETAEFSSTFGTSAAGTPCVAMLHEAYTPNVSNVRIKTFDLSGGIVDNARISVVIHGNN